MQWSNHLRSRKPDVLQLIEKRLWKAILNIVNEPGNYLAILKTFASEFPSTYVEELRTEFDAMSDFFTIIPSNAIQSSQEWNADNQASSSLQSASLPSSSLLNPPQSNIKSSTSLLPSNGTTDNNLIPISQPETSAHSLPTRNDLDEDPVHIVTCVKVKDDGENGHEDANSETGIMVDCGETGEEGVRDADSKANQVEGGVGDQTKGVAGEASISNGEEFDVTDNDDGTGIMVNLLENGEKINGDEDSSIADQEMSDSGVGDRADRAGVQNFGNVEKMDVDGDMSHEAGSGEEKDEGEVRVKGYESAIPEGMNVDEDADGDAVHKAKSVEERDKGEVRDEGKESGIQERMDVDGDAVHNPGSGLEKDKGEVSDKRNEWGVQQGMEEDVDVVMNEDKTKEPRPQRFCRDMSSNLSKSTTPVRRQPSFRRFKRHPVSTDQPSKFLSETNKSSTTCVKGQGLFF